MRALMLNYKCSLPGLTLHYITLHCSYGNSFILVCNKNDSSKVEKYRQTHHFAARARARAQVQRIDVEMVVRNISPEMVVSDKGT